MTYPSLTDNFNLETWNANFKELKDAQDNVPLKTLMFYPDNQFGSIVSTDLDAITTSGFYTCASSATNAPFTTASAFIYHHQANAATDAWQRATSYADCSEKIRYKRAGSWTSWIDFVAGDMLASVYATNGATGTVDNSIALNGHADTYFQAAEAGKGLSTNDYTTAEKTKLSGIAENANNYSLPSATASVLGGVKKGSRVTITDGVISADITTKSYSNISVLTSAWATNPKSLTGEAALYTAGYVYRAPVTCSGMSTSYYSLVEFGAAEAVGGNYAPISIEGTDLVYIYAKTAPSATITVASVQGILKGA